MKFDSAKTLETNQKTLSTPLYTVLNGGLNDKLSPSEISDTECRTAENITFSQKTGMVSTRPASDLFISAAIEDGGGNYLPLPATGLHQSIFTDPNTGEVYKPLIVTGGSKIFRSKAIPSEQFDWYEITGSLVRTSTVFSRVRMVDYGNATYGTDDSNPMFCISNTYGTTEVSSAPRKCKFIETYQDHIFLAGDPQNPTRLYFSAKGDPLTWTPATNSFEVGARNDGDSIKGLAVAFGCLVILKRKSVYVLTGTNKDDFTLTRISNKGMVSNQACNVALNNVYYVSDEGINKITEDKSTVSISYLAINIYAQLVKGSGNNSISVGYDRKNSLIFVSGSIGTVGSNPQYNITIVHDLNNINQSTSQPAFHIWKFPVASDYSYNVNPTIWAEIDADNSEKIPVFVEGKSRYVYTLSTASAYDDIGGLTSSPILSKVDFKMLAMSDAFAKKKARYIRLIFENLPTFTQTTNNYIKAKLTYSNSYDTTTNIGEVNIPTTGSSTVRITAPQPASQDPANFIGFSYESRGMKISLIGYEIEYVNYGRRV